LIQPVVVGGSQNIDSGFFKGLDNGVGSVKLRIPGIALGWAA
jgi:hypothetical protein